MYAKATTSQLTALNFADMVSNFWNNTTTFWDIVNLDFRNRTLGYQKGRWNELYWIELHYWAQFYRFRHRHSCGYRYQAR